MDIGKMMKQVQQMQDKMANAQEALTEEVVEASVGGGHVNVKANAVGDVLEIKISPEAVDPNDVEMLEELVLKGVMQAIIKGREVAKDKMGEFQSGLGLPPGMGF